MLCPWECFSVLFSIAVLLLCRACFCVEIPNCQNVSCGNLTNISYPFGLSGSNCGHPDYQIHCESEIPHLMINDISYTILGNPLYNQSKLTIANDGVWLNPICGLPDADVNLTASPFSLDSSYTNKITLANRCMDMIIGFFPFCNNSWLYTLNQTPIPLICSSFIQVPIRPIALGLVPPVIDVIKQLREGFQIQWNKTEEAFQTCKNCMAEEGICGFNKSFTFVCYLPENQNSSKNSGSPVVDPPKNASPKNASPAPIPNPVEREKSIRSTSKSYMGITIGVCFGSALLILAAGIGVFLFCKRDPTQTPPPTPPPKKMLETGLRDKDMELGPFPSKRGSDSLLFFTYQELEQATDSFNAKRELGDGGFASVYLGKLCDGRLVAVKKLYHDNCKRVEQFRNEVQILSSLNHPNLILLIGYCQYRCELLLVYEYVSNGALADHLHGETKGKHLVWETRLDIALETAQALAYLHFCVKPPIFHRDIKSSNILLDENFRAKVADFGLSRLVPLEATHVSTGPQGTPGYLDPDYHLCYRLTDKSDVYSFGVVLAELISAKKAIDMARNKMEIGLANLVVSKIQCGALQELVDPNLGIDKSVAVKEMVGRVAELAFRCLASEKDDRPNMREVAAQLQEIKQFGYGASCPKKELNYFYSFDSNSETKKLLNHMYSCSPTSVQEKWISTSTTPDSSQ